MTLNIGYLVIQMFGHTIDALDIEIEHGPVAPYLLQIWPATAAAMWPPTAIMNGSDLEIVKRAWDGKTVP